MGSKMTSKKDANGKKGSRKYLNEKKSNEKEKT